jgi:ribose-phosphate pyrophosphokinase
LQQRGTEPNCCEEEKALIPVEELLLSNLMSESEVKSKKQRGAKQHSGGSRSLVEAGNMSLYGDHRHLGVNGKATVGRFADGEVNVVVQENVRGKDVYVVQPSGACHDNIMELLLMVSTSEEPSLQW